MLLDVLLDAQVDPDFFDGVDVRVKLVLDLEDLTEASAAQLVYLLKLLVVAVTLDVLAYSVAWIEVPSVPLDGLLTLLVVL